MKPTTVEIGGKEYTIYPPTGFDLVATAQMEDFERTCELLKRTVKVGDEFAFKSYEECAAQPLPLLLQLEQGLAEVLTFGVPDPLSAS